MGFYCWCLCLPFAGLKSTYCSHMQSETNLCCEEIRYWPRLAKVLKCGNAPQRGSAVLEKYKVTATRAAPK